MFKLTRQAQAAGLELVVETDVSNQTAKVMFKIGENVIAKHPDLFSASVWLDGYTRGGHRERHMDRTVC